MSYTTHGWHIPGTPDALDEGGKLPKRARCGGVRLCGQCKTEALAALPSDAVAAEDLRVDLEALANPQGVEVLPVEIFRPNYYTFPAMQFTGDYESFEDIKTWLTSHGHTCAFWENEYNRQIDDRENQVQFRTPVGDTRTLHPGDWLVLWISPWDRNNTPGPKPAEFKAYSQENFEHQMERATLLVPVPWNPDISGLRYEANIQPELKLIEELKTLRAPELDSRF